ncbi:uncharacterized protein LOC125482246 [Rhincodon typus]|uniref:uncharacterized protein LOC125482246 n=1 Tax=Rhincodon typus TaxID=259920 RepID=UPI0020305BB5|nr:uncharacterized protein LOC125482246 [Rhincodon typus]XP_048450238.1 uncharacterized protein LOC125482246 [Rhincodon typus]
MYATAGLFGPFIPRRFVSSPEALLLPPIRMHNFYSRPFTIVMMDMDNLQEGAGKHIEYHHFYGAPYFYPYWYMPPANLATYMYPSYYPYNEYYPHQHPLSSANWPDGSILKGELHWGKMERVFGPVRELPDFVQDELRRVYGTYPKTIVTISYQNGEYLVKGEPKVGEQKYKVEKKVIRRPATPSDEEDDSVSEVAEKHKRKSKR